MREDPKFGTDGVRGVANADLSAFFTFRLGRAAGGLVASSKPGQPILVGRDTRISGDMLRCALAAGLLSTGADVVDLGVLPTPGVAFLTRQTNAAAGVMISASHNPAPDNGIKFFAPTGHKIADETETAMEDAIDDFEQFPSPTGGDLGRLRTGVDLVEQYAQYLIASARADNPAGLSGLRIVMDCGNGAASELGPRVARELGAQVISLHDAPNGTNINAGCGATHPKAAQAAVREHGAHLAVSFDGDADRAILADESGELVDGDRVMAMCAIAWKDTDHLPGNQVVGTVMSNIGLERGLEERGIKLHRASVGDRFVAETMRETGSALGGEKSGHIIFSRLATTGDGILTFLQVAGLMQQSGRPLSELSSQIREYPQLLVNVPVWRRRGWRVQPDLWDAVRAAEARLGNQGRILVRASGTERLIRVMAEGPDDAQVHEVVESIASVVRDKMGSPPPGADEAGDD